MSHSKDTPLRNVRRARTLTQEQLAALAGVSQETLSRAERGLAQLSPDVQSLIATILGTTKTELFPETEQVSL